MELLTVVHLALLCKVKGVYQTHPEESQVSHTKLKKKCADSTNILYCVWKTQMFFFSTEKKKMSVNVEKNGGSWI